MFVNGSKFKKLLSELTFIAIENGWDSDDFIIYGSTPLHIIGKIGDVSDIDVVLRKDKWPKNWKPNHHVIGDIEFFDRWYPKLYGDEQTAEKLINDHSFMYDGVYFVNPKNVMDYKIKLNRKKDQNILNKPF